MIVFISYMWITLVWFSCFFSAVQYCIMSVLVLLFTRFYCVFELLFHLQSCLWRSEWGFYFLLAHLIFTYIASICIFLSIASRRKCSCPKEFIVQFGLMSNLVNQNKNDAVASIATLLCKLISVGVNCYGSFEGRMH